MSGGRTRAKGAPSFVPRFRGLKGTVQMMKKLLLGLGALVVILLLGAGGGFLWAKGAASSRLAKTYESHRVDFPIPFPLTEAELAELRAQRGGPAGDLDGGTGADPLAGVDLTALARERAAARGKHLVESLYPCIECHGKDFGGGTMIDAPPIGKILGVNLTSGKGGEVAGYKASDWDRIVRHGILPDGRPTAMPSGDFFAMSDRELSDIVTYIQSVPPVDKTVPRPTLGPVGTLLMATGQLRLSAEEHKDHRAGHQALPPPAEGTAEYGKHLVQVCTGCHGTAFAGGPIVGGDPSWPPARNLTPHQDGLRGWSFDDFVRALREAKRKNGTPIRPPMSLMVNYAANMTETELRAMWAYLQTVPPVASPPQ